MKSILIIDNDASTCESLASYFSEIGYLVHTADNGLVGLGIIRKNKPDVIISDIRMPCLNGIELACIIKSMKYNIPLILISSYDNIEVNKINACSYAFVQKPIDIRNLKNSVCSALAA